MNRFKFHVYGDVSRAIHNLGLEVAMCLEVRFRFTPSFSFTLAYRFLPSVTLPPFHVQDKVECKKDFELCVGGCSGDLTSTLKYDFSTMIATSELNPDVLGEDGFHASNADCNVRQGVIEVELFEGGDSFKTFAVRMQTRCALATTSTHPLLLQLHSCHTRTTLPHPVSLLCIPRAPQLA